ncbi:MAG: DNA-directed RNA polymerase subunit beta' [Candidatus Marinimicrobia bacterium]|nr:DNA-directed RNA polymerase subunit beta' [Candidatus Neomarinimicrobiota bacterium]
MSPEMILNQSYGEVLKPETINYRSYKPEKDGLFCERIFGPVKDWECHCGKYKRIRYRGIICDRCGVEVTRKKVRRERMGHITLAVPVSHIWYLKSIPSKLSYLLGYSTKALEKIIYYENYVVLNPGLSGKEDGVLVDELEFIALDDEFGPGSVSDDDREAGNYFRALMGGSALREMLKKLDTPALIDELTKVANESASTGKAEDALKRLRVLKMFDPRIEKKVPNKADWMILTVLPVTPPELRPLVPLEGGRFAASDLNDLYRRIIIRNNRLKQLLEIKAPDVILRNEKRMLQEAVDSLFDNSRRGTAVRSGTRRPLKSLSDMLRGKQGRFRQNLLGKRVDYSGRSVIVVGPELQLHQCGLPKEMAMELFKPLIIRELMLRGFAKTPRGAKMMVEQKSAEVLKVLDYVVRDHPVLLNRAPTLHRLGIQAFQPVLVDGRAIKLHPLVTAAFNADFDGDQMAVHVPLSAQAKMEAWVLMLASHNILHPAHGNPVAIPSQDMVLGFYYMTRSKKGVQGEGMSFFSYDEARLAWENGEVDLHAIVNFRREGEWHKSTTVGRIIFNSTVPPDLDYFDELITKKSLERIVGICFQELGNFHTVRFLDRLKDMGFDFATRSGISIAISDILIPDEKHKIIEDATLEVADVQKKFERQILTEGERYNKIIDIWTHATNEVAAKMMQHLEADRDGFNSVYMMADSGARGSQDQIKQLAGMRGLMAKPQKSLAGTKDEIIENPITSNFKEGLSVLEYFISTHGARKGLADTALKTADAGYLTRRLVDVAQDVVITKTDCGTIQGLTATDLKDGEEVVEPLEDRIISRVILEDVYHPDTGKIMAPAGTRVDRVLAKEISDAGVEEVRIRSVLTCEVEYGLCATCYGTNLATGRWVSMGDAVGIIAAQSIGEPGTQLTLRTFHIGGTASRVIEQSEMLAKKAGKIHFSENFEYAEVEDESKVSSHVALVRNGKIEVIDENKRVLSTYKIPYGARVRVNEDQQVDVGEVLFTWDPYTDVILARRSGRVRFVDMNEGETYVEEAVEGGKKMKVIAESKNRNLSPHIEIIDPEGGVITGGGSVLPVKSTLMVQDGVQVEAGHILVKISREIGKSRDITGGLPRVAELFEARQPSNPAVVTEIDGVVKYGKTRRGIREMIILNDDGTSKKYNIPYGKHVIVHEGDLVSSGDRLCDGSVAPQDILQIGGPAKVQEYLVNEIQEVYRLQGVRINDKHIETIVRQMMQKIKINDPGDANVLRGDRINRFVISKINRNLRISVVITSTGDSDLVEGKTYPKTDFRALNKDLKAEGKTPAKSRAAKPATFEPLLLGITRASLNTESFISAASFQETTRVLTDAAVEGKTDNLRGLKENIVMGRLIPAGTGLAHYRKILVLNPDPDVEEKMEVLPEAISESIPHA